MPPSCQQKREPFLVIIEALSEATYLITITLLHSIYQVTHRVKYQLKIRTRKLIMLLHLGYSTNSQRTSLTIGEKVTPAERLLITPCSDEMISVGGTPVVLSKRSVRASAATDCKRKRNSAYDNYTAKLCCKIAA